MKSARNKMMKKIGIILAVIVFLILLPIKVKAAHVKDYVNVIVSNNNPEIGEVVRVNLKTKVNNVISFSSINYTTKTSGIEIIADKTAVSRVLDGSTSIRPWPVGTSFTSEGQSEVKFKVTKPGAQSVTFKMSTTAGKIDPKTGLIPGGEINPDTLEGGFDGQVNATSLIKIDLVVKKKEEQTETPTPDPEPETPTEQEETPKPSENKIPKVKGVKPRKATFIVKDDVNVRPHNSTKYSPIGLLRMNQEVEVTGEIMPWIQIRYNGKTGYVLSNFLEEKNEEAEERKKQEEEDARKNIQEEGEQLKELENKFHKIPEVGNTKSRRIKKMAKAGLPITAMSTFAIYIIIGYSVKKKSNFF